MQTIETELEIDAPADRVWATFGDFERWPDWNPFAVSLKGRVAVGEKLEVRLEPPSGRAMTIKPKVMAFEPESELRWLGHLLIPGIFDGEHQFCLETIEGNRTRFIHREEFGGLLVGLVLRSVREGTTAGFEAMNRALKERVEATTT